MDSREILPGAESIRFLLDSASLDKALSAEHSPLRRLLKYREYEDFEFFRTPNGAESEALNDIEAFEIEMADNEEMRTIMWKSEHHRFSSAVRYVPQIYEWKIEDVDWNEPEVTFNDLVLVDTFNDLIRNREWEVDILVTENPSILNNRRLLEYEFRRFENGRLHIMTGPEAAELAGIYMRSKDDFVFYTPSEGYSSYQIDFTLWYWTLPWLFIQHTVGNNGNRIGPLLDRFESLLYGIDQLGEQYYSGIGNHTDIRTRYHFNNCISLLTGICDTLALHTRDKYNIPLPDRRTNLRTGSHPLLKELREHNKKAWQFVHENHEVIELLHVMRNDIIHKSGVIKRGPGFSLREHNDTIDWESQSISLDTLKETKREKFRKYYESIDDSVQKYDPVTKWGVITLKDEQPQIYEHTQIEPYRFLKQATKEIAEFSDEYLRLLGHQNRLKSRSDSGAIKKHDIQRISNRGLFPLIESEHSDSIQNIDNSSTHD